MANQLMITRRTILSMMILASCSVSAQDPDFGIWEVISGSYEIVKNLESSVSIGMKVEDNLRTTDQYYFQPEITYDIKKWLSAGAYYRLIKKNEDDGMFHNRYRQNIFLKGDIETGRLAFSLRTMYQRATRTYIEKDKHRIPEQSLRVKFQAEYDIKKSPLKPYISLEPYIPIDKGNGFEIDKTRYSAGFDIKISDRSRIDAGYLLEDPKKADEGSLHVLSFEYKLEF